jgi:hypothetical protein
MKQGRAISLKQGEHMAARLFSAVAKPLGCDCCHLCSSDTGGNRQQQEPASDVEAGRWIPHYMEFSMACANIRNPKGKCWRKLAMMALAVGKEVAISSLLGASSVGYKLKVCHGRMLRFTEQEAVQCAGVPLAFCALVSCLCVQLYHYTGVQKDQGISTLNPKSVVLTVDDSRQTDELEASEGLEGNDSTSKSHEPEEFNEQHGPVTCQDTQYPLVAPSRTGHFFEGTIKMVDEKAQACFVLFMDGDYGWFQLWRAGEVVVLLDKPIDA